jgi:predicted DNA binding CopG/RHH family protein
MKKQQTMILDDEEQSILAAFESGEFESVLSDDRKTELLEVAQASVKKDKRINIRIAQRDLDAIQRKALQEGMPYQTLIASVLHKYASGSLTEQRA